jgi:hypothetical protein
MYKEQWEAFSDAMVWTNTYWWYEWIIVINN